MVAESKSDTSPIADHFSIETVIAGISADLRSLRAGDISVEDARTRAELAKQFFNGVRLVISAQKFLATNAKLIPAAAERMQQND